MPAAGGARPEPRSTADVLRDAIENAQDIIRYEIRLAKIEIKQEAIKAGIAIGGLVAGGTIVLYGVGFLLTSLYIGISYAIWPWLSALVIGAFLVLAGGIVAGWGFRKLRHVRPTPEQTVESLREDLQWLRRQTR